MRTSTAATLAPHIDRLALCVHGPSGRNPELRAAIDALGLPAGSMLVVAARLLVHDGLRPGDLAALNRYVPPSWSAANERTHVERGFLLERTGGVLEASPRFRDAAALALHVQEVAARELWGDVDDIAALAVALVDDARTRTPAAAFPAFTRQVETRPSRSLLAAVTELRYLRADAHAAALAAHGVKPRDAIELTKRWKGFGDPLPTDQHERRQAIEDDTDERVADALGPDDATRDLLERLVAIPGDDPRPPEDR